MGLYFGAGIWNLVEGLQRCSCCFQQQLTLLPGTWTSRWGKKYLHLQCALEVCINSSGPLALPNTPSRSLQEQHQTLLALLLQSHWDRRLYPAMPGGDHLLGLQRAENLCLKNRLWVCVTGKRGDKGERKKGRHKEEWDGNKEEAGRRERKGKMEIHGDSQTSAAVRDSAAVSKESVATGAPFTWVPSEHSGVGLRHQRQDRACHPQSSSAWESSCAFNKPI